MFILMMKLFAAYIKEHAKSGDVVLTVGAGDVVLVGEKYLSK